uniref:Uncharacterized protein n=1 Tax=Arundo donax TaxID=35708 RepID=A0A0A9HMN1_ARUDO
MEMITCCDFCDCEKVVVRDLWSCCYYSRCFLKSRRNQNGAVVASEASCVLVSVRARASPILW